MMPPSNSQPVPKYFKSRHAVGFFLDVSAFWHPFPIQSVPPTLACTGRLAGIAAWAGKGGVREFPSPAVPPRFTVPDIMPPPTKGLLVVSSCTGKTASEKAPRTVVLLSEIATLTKNTYFDKIYHHGTRSAGRKCPSSPSFRG